MKLPNIWSQGQLFAFSALDGESYASDDFTGTLLGDKIGIRFYSGVRRELVIINKSRLPYKFRAVTSDYISISYGEDAYCDIVYAKRHLIIGKTRGVSPMVFVEGECETTYSDNVLIQDTKDGEFTAFYNDNGFFAFAYGKSIPCVLEKIAFAKNLNVQTEIEKKLSFWDKYGKADSPLYNKCLSTMKTQLYSPEGFFKGIWSTPDRLPHKWLWLWDSVFHAVGFRNFDADLAKKLILNLFDIQEDSGFIPHRATSTARSSITQPPVIAWGAYKVYEKSGNKDFLKTVFENNKKFLEWCRQNRKITDKELYTWNTQSDVNCRCDESGMDNSPRFDVAKRLFAIDFSCFMANETKYMKKIAEQISLCDEAEYFSAWNDNIVNDINETLWCEEDGFYYDFIIEDNKFNTVASVASFLPLFADVCTKERAERLLCELKNPETFYTEFPIPSISKKDATFGSDMWRGPVWINYNYMIYEGLKSYGYEEFAGEIREKTITVLENWYEKKGTLFEYYDSQNLTPPEELNRKGKPLFPYNFTVKYQTVREYGWSNALLLDLLHNR
ncbi:MAG: hypothetical protein IIW16_04515 [Clostridia bacterium]|nr:hypothetical protein [Clostridia bacterium]